MFGYYSNAQPPLDWVSTPSNGSQDDYVTDIFVDPAGNTYVCGNFKGSITFGSDNLFTNGGGEVFIVKYDPTGNPLWARQSNSVTDQNQTIATSIFVDALGNVYVCGYHSHNQLLFSGLPLNSSSNNGFYIVKLTSNGTPIHLTGPTGASTGKSRADAIVGNGNFIFVTGSHEGALSLPGGPTLPVTQGGSDVFVARVDSAFLAFTYAVSHGGPSDDMSSGIDLNGNELYATGNYGSSTCTFFAGTNYVLPNYGNNALWLTRFNGLTGAVSWATSAGSSYGTTRSNDVLISGPQLFIVGGCSDSTVFVDQPAFTGPFVYDDTIFTNGGLDAFVARYNAAGFLQTEWNEGGIGTDEAFGIVRAASCSEIEICGSFEDSVNFGGTTPLIANDISTFIMASDNAGVPIWVDQEISDEDIIPTCIHYANGRTSIGGHLNGDGYFSTNPLTSTSLAGVRDHYVFSLQCASPTPCNVSIDACAQNDTVVAPSLCQYPIGNYTGGIPVTDGCSTGSTSVIQSPSSPNILGPGINEVKLTASDGIGNEDVCFFEVVVKTTAAARIAECGTILTNETSGGDGNQFSNFSCSPIDTPGQDAFYQVTVDAETEFLQIKISNFVDANDPYLYVYWLSNNCPDPIPTCVNVDSMDVTNGEFSNNSEYLTFTAPFPGTYFLVIDSKVDSIESYDIEFNCSTQGIDFDVSGSCGDSDFDGIIPSVNGSLVDLTMQPCESVQICNRVLIQNQTWEWVDSVQYELGDCYENINVATISPAGPNSGEVDLNGEWTPVYDLPNNSITWSFANSTGNPWGDGVTPGAGAAYNCNTAEFQNAYDFCFEADIAPGCMNSEGLTVGIKIGDDREKNGAAASNFFLIGTSNDFILQDDNPFFSYPTATLCDGDPSILPDSITTSGGSFTATAGIVFVDANPTSATGEIDLTASSIGGPYTVTYTVGLCPFTHDFIVDIFAQDDPSFNYPNAAYCQGETDPLPNITGTSGGTFTANPGVIFTDGSPSPTGEIDLDASTAGGPYWIVYTTPGPECVNVDSVQVTINAEDDPTIAYAAIDHCADDANVLPTTITTPGGTFSEWTGNLLVNAGTGEVDIMNSPEGSYYVVYTTPGPDCPNTDSVEFIILPEDDPTFSYSAAAYCQHETNPVGNISGTGGGTFSGPAGISFANVGTGEIDLLGSTAGGPYWIVYTTPGPDCPNSDSVQITINAEDDSTFTYPSTAICFADTNPVANISGTTGGTFTATGGLIFTDGSPSSTGEIDITATGTGGPFTITYTTPGPDCPNDLDVVVNIFAEDDPTISYSPLTFCSDEVDPIPTVATPGGTFTGPVTFVDNITGEIDLDASTPGFNLEIVYTSPGPECPNTDTAFITINPKDIAGISYADTLFCETDPVAPCTITGSISGNWSTMSPTELALNVSDGEIDIPSSTPGGPYDVTFITIGVCPDTMVLNITIFESPTADAGPDQDIFGRTETQLAAVPVTVGQGIWSIISGSGTINDQTDSTSMISDLPSGETTLEWTVSNGVCPDAIDEMSIFVNDIFVPQALTPNGDGNNDYFVIEGVDVLENTVEIFNRWGQVVYETSNYQNNWQGTDASGNELVNDTYFYIINIGDEKLKGYVVLKR